MSHKSRRLDRLARLARTVDRHEADLKRKIKNEDVVRLEKNGEISYGRIRTVALTREEVEAAERSAAADRSTVADASGASPLPASGSNLLPNNLPETPVCDAESADRSTTTDAFSATEVHAAEDVANEPSAGEEAQAARINCHEQADAPPEPSAAAPPTDPPEVDPLEDLLVRAAALASVRRGRPPAFDELLKAQLVALLSVGLSMRQAAGLLNVSHTTVQNTLKSEPQLEDEVNSARFRAQLEPLACVIREARRSWRAATWLLKYLDAKVAAHEETPQEQRERRAREREEFFARCDAAQAKRRA